MAPTGLWERGSEASGFIPPSGRLFPLSDLAPLPAVDPQHPHRAPKAHAISPSGETGASPSRGAGGKTPALPSQLAGEAQGSGGGAPGKTGLYVSCPVTGRRISALADGTIFDADTGEIHYEPPTMGETIARWFSACGIPVSEWPEDARPFTEGQE
tara:strand:+ start:331 stop:798 length:468 start_codon:yes stop_codon:yes gene_type:complete